MTKTYEERLRDAKRFHIRDIKTKDVKYTFRSVQAAKYILDTMRFGLSYYYEIWDSKRGIVVKPLR